MASDNMAPVIKLKETDLERQNSISVTLEPISVSLGAADAITSNSALVATLQKKRGSAPATLPPTSKPSSGPANGVSPADFYFPIATRNLAPQICLDTTDNSLSVSFETVKAEVAGVASTSEKEVPFWKQPKPSKWSPAAVATAAGSPSETLDTTEYEMYFPSSVRNVAPAIVIKAPEDCLWNEQPYIQVGSEFVPFNKKTNKMIVLPEDVEDALPLQAASTIVEHYPDNEIYIAPKIDINGPAESVGVCMETVEVDETMINEIFAKYK